VLLLSLGGLDDENRQQLRLDKRSGSSLKLQLLARGLQVCAVRPCFGMLLKAQRWMGRMTVRHRLFWAAALAAKKSAASPTQPLQCRQKRSL
jgi:hypothetical protein